MMARPQILIDSSFLYTLLDRAAGGHTQARAVIMNMPGEYLIPQVALTETAFLFRRAGGVPSVARFIEAVIKLQFSLIGLESADLERARTIILAYPTAKLDFVDCCVAALAERLNITHICTYDRRDFEIIRPQHTAHFQVLPVP
jgi:predicted nucleic acid-binding protein